MRNPFPLLFVLVLLCPAVSAMEVSTKNNIGGHMEYAGYTIVPAVDVAAPVHPEDPGPTRVFELIRPYNQSVTLGRLYTSCTCIRMETDKKSYGSGERVLITVRNVQPTKGQTYPFYVQVNSPLSVILRHDIHVVSDRFAADAAPVEAADAPDSEADTAVAVASGVVAAAVADTVEAAGAEEEPAEEESAEAHPMADQPADAPYWEPPSDDYFLTDSDLE